MQSHFYNPLFHYWNIPWPRAHLESLRSRASSYGILAQQQHLPGRWRSPRRKLYDPQARPAIISIPVTSIFCVLFSFDINKLVSYTPTH